MCYSLISDQKFKIFPWEGIPYRRKIKQVYSKNTTKMDVLQVECFNFPRMHLVKTPELVKTPHCANFSNRARKANVDKLGASSCIHAAFLVYVKFASKR